MEFIKKLEIPLYVAYNAFVEKRARNRNQIQKGISSEQENSKKTQATQAKNSIPAPRYKLGRAIQADVPGSQHSLSNG
jgi:hypothetical protein